MCLRERARIKEDKYRVLPTSPNYYLKYRWFSCKSKVFNMGITTLLTVPCFEFEIASANFAIRPTESGPVKCVEIEVKEVECEVITLDRSMVEILCFW